MLKLIELLETLHLADIEFVIVGGIAARLNGSTLPTEHLDVCCRMTEANMERVGRVFQTIEPVIRGDPRNLKPPTDPKRLLQCTTLIMVTKFGNFDVIADVQPIGRYEQVIKESVVMEVEGRPTYVLNIDALIAAKKAAGRRKDKLGVMYLESAKKRREIADQEPGLFD